MTKVNAIVKAGGVKGTIKDTTADDTRQPLEAIGRMGKRVKTRVDFEIIWSSVGTKDS